jgi:hypothetical protein
MTRRRSSRSALSRSRPVVRITSPGPYAALEAPDLPDDEALALARVSNDGRGPKTNRLTRS